MLLEHVKQDNEHLESVNLRYRQQAFLSWAHSVNTSQKIDVYKFPTIAHQFLFVEDAFVHLFFSFHDLAEQHQFFVLLIMRIIEIAMEILLQLRCEWCDETL